MQTLANHHVLMEEYFVTRNIQRALRSDEFSPDSVTSSVVDDVFYILKKAIRRGLSTHDVNGFCAVMNLTTKALESDYLSMLQKRASSIPVLQDFRDPKIMRLIVSLNNLDVSAEYLATLRTEIERDVHRLFSYVGHKEMDKIDSCVAMLADHIPQFKRILQTGLEQFFQYFLRNRLRMSFAEACKDVQYRLSEEAYTSYELEDQFVKRFLAEFMSMFAFVKKNFTENNNATLVALAVEFIAQEFETLIVNRRFNLVCCLFLSPPHLSFFLRRNIAWQSSSRQRLARINIFAFHRDGMPSSRKICQAHADFHTPKHGEGIYFRYLSVIAVS